ncbi:hypothetical protein GVN20_06460 [Runella sp. CRIBMP]|uniref:hypothetical protein n=1 Tax=Runella sp. CRIBMP TaxID=2683261 RepID=UPI001411CB55|nr:hypothetical protein [Runella sp. CRIBMP]NBB18993.1 hypothetical protein [Runella sp. CRIBMP]
MKAYNETLLLNEYAQKMAKKWHTERLLSTEQLAEVVQSHAQVPYNPNVFIKIGLFLFGYICFMFGGGFVFMIMGEGGGFAFTALLYGLGVTFLLLRLIKRKQLHFAGVDNALIYGIIGATMPLIFELYDALKINEIWVGVLFCLPVLVVVVYSFGEPLVALGAFLSGMFILASILMKNPIGKALLPFALMIYAAAFFVVTRNMSQKSSTFYWKLAIYWVNTAALVLFYAAGNYFVVRELNAELNGLGSPSPEVAFAGLFWVFSILIPMLYLYGGFRWRNRTLLLLGLLGIVATILTVRYYHAMLAIEWVLILVGVVAAVSAFALIRSLKTPKFGFIYATEKDNDERFAIEMVVISQMTKNSQSAENGVEFGGGDFAGGGAEDKY